jgi:hypothetical protein
VAGRVGPVEEDEVDVNVESVENISFDQANLYREEIFTDLRVGTIRQLTPVDSNGARDISRPVVFIGQTQVLSQMGSLPIQARIEARTLKEAMDAFPRAVKQAIDELVEEVNELRRQEMSRIVVPGADAASKILGGR